MYWLTPLKSWKNLLEEIERRYETKISEMEAEHKKEVAALKEEIRERDEKIKELTAKNDALTEEVSRLKSIINTDCGENSSMLSDTVRMRDRRNFDAQIIMTAMR